MPKIYRSSNRQRPQDAVIKRAAEIEPVVSDLFRELTREAGSDRLYCVSLVPPTQVPPGELVTFSMENHVRRLKASLAHIDMTAVFAADISYNEHKSGLYPPFWGIHWWGHAKVFMTVDELRRRLKLTYPPSLIAPRAYNVQPWDGSEQSVRYALKPNFERRIGYGGSMSIDGRTGQVRFSRNTRKREIRVAALPELDAFLERVGVYGRLAAIGAQVRRGPNGLKLVALRPTAEGERATTNQADPAV